MNCKFGPFILEIQLGMVRVGNMLTELKNTGVVFVVSQNMLSTNIPVKTKWEIKNEH